MLVQNGISGFIFNPDSVEDIAQAITAFAGLNAAARTEMGKQVRAFTEQNLSQEKCTAEYENML